ncbi:methyltransferase domain-containing protein [Sulfurimonas sp. SAG-AH-194-C20]|nr:class I SAM-dependent methyltransferase [Sulfurimonas sp. SAG-AH-194-C20]MDF1878684.1 methyltransferase domain-containing protein [Sulfurimonas sp. SAG-AH-194-C20]
MYNFTNTSMHEIITRLSEDIDSMQAQEIVEFEVFNPDNVKSTYAGELINVDSSTYIYRGYKTWVDLAQQLKSRILTPKTMSENTILIRFEKLNSDDSFHQVTQAKEEKYGSRSIFSKIHKNEESSFIYYYIQALKNVNINQRIKVLNLGVNSGDEFEAIMHYSSNFKNLELVGIDYCSSAIKLAKEKFKNETNISFYTHDINQLNALNIGEFDLIISIGTLQSSNLEFNKLLMSIVQNQLKKDGSMILGFPNCRWIDGEMIYGARVKNYPFSEMGLLYKDVMFSKKYLQQKKYRVTITGKDYIFICATSIRKD